MKHSERFLKHIADYSYISFDIFDTLILRDVHNTNDIYLIVEEKLKKRFSGLSYDFDLKRRRAFNKAIQKNKVEISLEDIYEELDSLPLEYKNICKQIEIETEIQYARLNEDFKAILDWISQHKKKLVLISDMYLSEEVIRRILAKNNIRADYLFISSSLQKRKSSGELYKYVLKELGIKNNEIVHIGDNVWSDYIIPRNMGINSIIYKKRGKKQYNILGDNILCSYLSNCDEKKTIYYSAGYRCFGPALFGFCQWIHSNSIINKYDNLLFLSRDGKIVQKIYNMMYPEEKTSYFYVSRRSLTVPLLTSAQSFKDICSSVPYIKNNEKIEELLYKIGIEDKNYIDRIRGMVGDTISKYELLSSTGEKLFHLIEEPMKKNAENERENAIQYLKQNLIGNKYAIIDIGWYGTMQYSLGELLKDDSKLKHIRLDGYYFGILKNKNTIKNTRGYIYDYNSFQYFDDSLIFGFNGLIETFFVAGHGSVKKYDSQDEEITPVFEEFEYTDFSKIEDIDDGAIQFTYDIKNILIDYELSNKASYQNLNRLLTNPTKEEIKAFGSLYFYDVYYEKLISGKSLISYIKAPKRIIDDYSHSNWKIAFLKNILPFSIGYKIIYKASRLLQHSFLRY